MSAEMKRKWVEAMLKSQRDQFNPDVLVFFVVCAAYLISRML